ncbi:EF-hand domain-containing protein [Thalassovita aquimarina]|uniref:EF-hand domain-containing protein n=1 Tax=Thalassovita aquimarina TaxID=2785917 RepID=UPI0035660DA4
MRIATRLNTAAIALTLASPVLAEQIDASLDTDGDGSYSFAELSAAFPDLTEELFAEFDISAEGLLDAQEVSEMKKAGAFPMKEG